MRWATRNTASVGVVCGLIALATGVWLGGCSAPNYTRNPGLDGTGGGTAGTGGSPEGSGGASEGSGGDGPIATGGGSAGENGGGGNGGVVGSGGRGGTAAGGVIGGTGATAGTQAPGTGGGNGGVSGGGSGGTAGASGGATAATGGRGTGGGTATGGSGTGGANTGGANTGGANTGGANTGGANTGGANTGGANTGGMGSGGVPVPSGAILYYPFDETTGTTAADQSGNSRNGMVTGGGTFGAGVVRNGLTFMGGTTATTSSYVTIPVGLLTSTRDMTISLWVKVTTDHTWQRILDFSKSTTTGYMFLTPHAETANVMRFAITTTGISGEQSIDAPLLPLGTWKHLTLVFGAAGASFFVDGVKVATKPTLTVRPADLGLLTNQWLGRSTFPSDPYFAGQLDELRIYGRALSDAEVGVLYNLR